MHEKYISLNSKKIEWKSISGINIVFVADSGEFFELNDTAKVIWDLIRTGQMTASDILNKLCEIFSDENKNKLSEDLNEFLKELKKKKIILEKSKKTRDNYIELK